MKIGRKKRTVHRVVWIDAFGEPPADKPHVLHHCDRRTCFRLEHLYVGTNRDNVRDRVIRGRSSNGEKGKRFCSRGHPFVPENTRIYRGGRICAICANWRRRNFYNQQVGKALEPEPACLRFEDADALP